MAFDKEGWRMQAKYETECQRCGDWIEPGQWIVKEDDFDQYVHCVCPCDLRKRQKAAAEEPQVSCKHIVMKIIDGEVVKIEVEQ